MITFGQDKVSMPLTSATTPLIKPGWIRALILFLVYVALSTFAGYVTKSTEMWIGASFLIGVSLVYLFTRFIDKKSFDALGLKFSNLFPNSITGLLLSIFMVSTGALIIFLLNGIEWIDISGNLNSVFFGGLLMLMVALAEEVVFRGYVLPNLSRSVNRWVALLISSMLFTIVHAGNPEIPLTALINTFLGGLLLGVTFFYSGTLWLPVLFHFGWNFMQGPVFGFTVSGLEFESVFILATRGEKLVSGGNYGFEASLVSTILLIMIIAFVTILTVKRERSGSSNVRPA